MNTEFSNLPLMPRSTHSNKENPPTPKSAPQSPRRLLEAITNQPERSPTPKHSYTTTPKGSTEKIKKVMANQQRLIPNSSTHTGELQQIQQNEKLYKLAVTKYNSLRIERQVVEKRELPTLFNKYPKLKHRLLKSSYQLKQDLTSKQRLKQLEIHKTLLDEFEGELSIAERPALKRVQDVFQKELKAFLVLGTHAYRFFETQRKEIEMACVRENLKDIDSKELTPFLNHWKFIRNNIDKAVEFEKKENSTLNRYEIRKLWLDQYAAHIKLYRQMKESALEKLGSTEDLQLNKQLESIKKLQKAIKEELNVVKRCLLAKSLIHKKT